MKNQKEIKNEEMKNQEEIKNDSLEISNEIKELSFIEKLKDEKIKSENFDSIINEIKDSEKKEISFIESLDKKFNRKSLNDIIEKSNNFELYMITKISRKEYYLFLYDNDSKKEYFIMKNNSIMKNKIYSLKLSQFLKKEIIINYIKNDRKNQSKENINHDNKEYSDKLKKYSSI